MIKVKDGYAKLIGTTYQGSATQVLLSNGGDLEYSASSKASTLVQRNASQHIYATYFNSAISDEALTDIGSVYVRNTSDTFIRRVSKTQFYSILDDKFVTLDTTQSITGAKTFSTSVRFANNASIIQNQNDTSNYTTILKWYKNGASRNTYDPSIGQHNTGGDGNGSICILPYPTETSPWGGMVGLFISKGVLKLDGKSVALAENYYTKTESDERYVNVTGDTMTGPLIVKAAIIGTQLISTIATGTSPLKVTSTTVVTNLNSDMVDGYHSFKLFRSFGGVSIDFNFSDGNNNNGLYYLHSNYTQSNKNGITYGSLMNFSSSASSWQIISGSDARLYYRNRWGSGGGGAWSAWKTIAYTSDIKDPANYYWANVRVSASSNSGTSPTFNTCYTSNWFRSTGSTGWYSESYGGGWYMTDSTWIRTYGSKSVYQNTGQIRTDGYLVTNGGITVGATSPNNGTYKSHVTGNSWSSGYIRAGAGFYHNSVNSNSYVLLAGGSYKSLADFAKGNAGASNRGVYVTNGTVTAMTYYLNATVNSGASGKLAYYRDTNSIDDYTSTIGSSSTPIYINNGIPNAANSYKVVNGGHYFSAFGISGYIYVVRYGQVVCVSINMSSGGDGSAGTTTLLTNLPSAVYTTGQSTSKGGGSALRYATFYVSGTRLYVYSNQANQLPNKVSFTYITNTLK